MAKFVPTALLIAAYWLPPALAISANHANPNIGTALGVAYGILAGLVIGVAGTIALAVFSKRYPALRPNYLIVGIAALPVLLLLPLADQGTLSSVTSGH